MNASPNSKPAKPNGCVSIRRVESNLDEPCVEIVTIGNGHVVSARLTLEDFAMALMGRANTPAETTIRRFVLTVTCKSVLSSSLEDIRDVAAAF